jgi:hypothetical protein
MLYYSLIFCPDPTVRAAIHCLADNANVQAYSVTTDGIRGLEEDHGVLYVSCWRACVFKLFTQSIMAFIGSHIVDRIDASTRAGIRESCLPPHCLACKRRRGEGGGHSTHRILPSTMHIHLITITLQPCRQEEEAGYYHEGVAGTDHDGHQPYDSNGGAGVNSADSRKRARLDESGPG